MPVLPELGLVRSEDLDEVLAAVDYDHAPYAGGTELVPAMGLGLRRPMAIVDLKRVEALKGIEVDATAESVTIGAAVTHRRLSDHAVGRAVGVWPTELPLTPPRVWSLLQQAAATEPDAG